MLALIFKHAAVVAMNFNQLIFVIQTARVFCEAAVACCSELLPQHKVTLFAGHSCNLSLAAAVISADNNRFADRQKDRRTHN
jgi:hypothetical protein